MRPIIDILIAPDVDRQAWAYAALPDGWSHEQHVASAAARLRDFFPNSSEAIVVSRMHHDPRLQHDDVSYVAVKLSAAPARVDVGSARLRVQDIAWVALHPADPPDLGFRANPRRLVVKTTETSIFVVRDPDIASAARDLVAAGVASPRILVELGETPPA